MKPINDIEAKYLKEVLEYNQDTGIFTWKKNELQDKRITGRFGGKIAGNVHQKTGYLRININKRSYLSHRLAWLYVTGKWPREHIDHIDGNKLNNKFVNLREANSSQNAQNTNICSANTSGFRGVNFHKYVQRWRAAIYVNKKRIELGHFDTKEEAAYFYNYAAEYYHGAFRRSA